MSNFKLNLEVLIVLYGIETQHVRDITVTVTVLIVLYGIETGNQRTILGPDLPDSLNRTLWN